MTQAILRHSRRDATLVALAAVHGAMVVLLVSNIPGASAAGAAALALGIWWNANTISHNFVHLPFFRSRAINALFSAYLSALIGVPQSLWRDRHLAHHAGREPRVRWSDQLVAELGVVGLVWGVMLAQGLPFFAGTWMAGWLGGMLLCTLQGRYEHARGTVSHYGRLYNWAFFNDGWHVEHHARPGLHWTELPRESRADSSPSRWPAVLRWLEGSPLNGLERLVLRSELLQRFVLTVHRRAFRRLLRDVRDVRRVTIVGGGLYPRTIKVFHDIAPGARLTVVDRSRESIERARAHLNGNGERVRFVEADYEPRLVAGEDVVVIPLAFVGDREAIYSAPPAPNVIVHDWAWRRRGEGRMVSWLLLKRINLVRQ